VSAHDAPHPGTGELRESAAWADLPVRGTVLATGVEAVKFTDGFTTAALARLEPATGTEAFFTDGRGWVIALATIMRDANGLWIDTPPGLAASLREHLEHYHIRERVDFVDASADFAHLLVAGPAAAAWLAARCALPPPATLCAHVATRLGDTDATIVLADWCGVDSFVVRVAADAAARLRGWFDREKLPQAAAAAIDAARIEARYPLPADIPEKTLPQELDRTARAISFTKGCYLGQETVARLDALGHVNRSLALLACDAQVAPASGTPILLDGEPVGTLTSVCFSPRLGCPAGLALVHRRGLAADAPLAVGGGRARVVAPQVEVTT